MAHVTINGAVQTVAVGTRLGDLLGALPCGGHGLCGKCRVQVRGSVSPLTSEEITHLSAAEQEAGVRLACRVTVQGDCSVDTLYDRPLTVAMDGVAVTAARAPHFAAYGIALDVGTTTLAGRLYDATGRLLAQHGCANPQRRYGADVLTRVQAAQKGQQTALTAAIREALSQLIDTLCRQAEVSPETVEDVVVTGNSVMLTLLANEDVAPFAAAPFTGHHPFGETRTAEALGLTALAPHTTVYLPPCVGAFFGGDGLCALLACGLPGETATLLMADIGTNGEIALWHQGRLLVCSTAAGPAFEGVGVSAGMPGCTGAIHRVEWAAGRLYPQVIDGATPTGLCGSGIVDAIACLLVSGVLEKNGTLEDAAEIAPEITLTTEDIQTVMLSKSAILSGIQTLLHRADIAPEQTERLCIAGGFGNCLNPTSARLIGLLPPIDPHRIHPIGNGALDGAALLLLNPHLRDTAQQLAEQMQVVDLATDPYFAQRFIENLSF